MKNILVKASNWKFILAAFLGTAYCIYWFQGAQAAMSQIVGQEVLMIDLRSAYTLDEIQHFFSRLTAEGRNIHQQATQVTDMIFPFVYGLLFILLSASLLRKITNPTSNWLYLSLFPILLMGVDFLENFQILHLLESYPDLTTEMVQHAAQLTAFKNLLTNLSLGLVVVLVVIRVGQWGQQKY